ncbi:Putative polysaccharide deacetylase (fragment) [uncultured delta proteobacterium]|uniref:Putative polysaccharide deacetylase n=1 Tax=uncultured delta proteobacterium TaxID=34034 RepID=A0A212KGN9_9DELT
MVSSVTSVDFLYRCGNRTQSMLAKIYSLLKRRFIPPVWRRYTNYLFRNGISSPCFFLSFDCDTDADAAAGIEVVEFLSELGIKASFAVPGTQLVNNRDIYRHLAASGIEFLNHGYLPHTEWDGEKYIARTFYNEMPRDAVEEDIRKADATIRDILGCPPKGFRAPHFGYFQKTDEVAFMHTVCASLGYTYASTTLPAYAFENGPAFLSHGIVELPVIGSWSSPHTILDSWNYLADRVHYTLSDTYYELFAETLIMAEKYALPMLFCWYADPSHVVGQSPFMKAMELVAGKGLATYSGSECAALWAGRLAGASCAV